MITKILATTTVLFFLLSVYFRLKPLKGLQAYKKELDDALHTIKLREAEITKLEGRISVMQKALDLAEITQSRQDTLITELQASNTDIRRDLEALRTEFNLYKRVFQKNG